jgi:hypothetical protein
MRDALPIVATLVGLLMVANLIKSARDAGRHARAWEIAMRKRFKEEEPEE